MESLIELQLFDEVTILTTYTVISVHVDNSAEGLNRLESSAQAIRLYVM